MRLSIPAGETQTVTIQGGRCYYENGVGRINFKMVGGGDARDFNLYAGQGFVCNEGERFYALEVKNIEAFDQDIEFEISDREVFDNRARIVSTGDVLPVVFTYYNSRSLNKVVVPAGVATMVLSADADRAKAALNFAGADCFLGVDNTVDANGFPITNGSDWVDENTAELWVYSVAGCNVFVFEDIK